MTDEKTVIRNTVIERLKALSEIDKLEKSMAISVKLVSDTKIQNANSVCIYMATANEVDLSILKEYLWENGKSVYLPRVDGDNLEIVKTLPNDELQENKWNIFEPSGKAITDLSIIDLIIVPLVAFDNNNNRLGHGKGYYDKLLPKLVNAKKIGVGFKIQHFEHIPTNNYDFALDEIVTE